MDESRICRDTQFASSKSVSNYKYKPSEHWKRPRHIERPSGLSFIGFLVNLLMSSVLIIPGMRAALRNSDHLGEQVGVKVAVGPMIIHQSHKSSFLWWGFNSMQDQDKKNQWVL